MLAQSLSGVRLFAIPWTVACQTPLSMEFSRQKFWNELPFPPLGDSPDLEIEPMSLALAGGFFTTVSPGKPGHATKGDGSSFSLTSLSVSKSVFPSSVARKPYHFKGMRTKVILLLHWACFLKSRI